MDDHTPPPHGGPLPPPAPPTPRPRWTDVPIARDHGRGKVGGVIAGLGRSYGFDLRLVRILFALACLFFPSLILAYLGAWILLPPEAGRAVSLRNMLRQGNRLSVGAIVGLAFIALTVLITIDSPFHASGVSWGVVLVMIGVLLWVGTDRLTGRTSVPSPTAPWPGAGTTVGQGPPTPPWAPAPPAPSAAGASPGYGAGAPGPSFGAARPPESARRRVPVGSVGFLLTVLGVGTAGLGHLFGWWTLSLLGTAVTTVLVLLGLVGLSAIVNRSYAPLLLVAPLALLATALLVVQPNLSGGVGQRTVAPATVAEAGARQRLAAGRLTIDLRGLRDLPTAERPVTIRAEVGFGQLRVLVPAGTVLDLRTSVGAGHVVVDGDEVGDGVRIDTTTVERPVGAATMTVIVDAEVGAGELAIERTAAATR